MYVFAVWICLISPVGRQHTWFLDKQTKSIGGTVHQKFYTVGLKEDRKEAHGYNLSILAQAKINSHVAFVVYTYGLNGPVLSWNDWLLVSWNSISVQGLKWRIYQKWSAHFYRKIRNVEKKEKHFSEKHSRHIFLQKPMKGLYVECGKQNNNTTITHSF